MITDASRLSVIGRLSLVASPLLLPCRNNGIKLTFSNRQFIHFDGNSTAGKTFASRFFFENRCQTSTTYYYTVNKFALLFPGCPNAWLYVNQCLRRRLGLACVELWDLRALFLCGWIVFSSFSSRFYCTVGT